MKILAEVEGQERALDIERDGERFIVELDGRRYALEASEPEAGVHLLIHGGKVYECRVREEARGQFRVSLRSREYAITLRDPRRLRSASNSAGGAAGRASIAAPMPGKVVRVLVERGAQVEAGAGVVVVEAMKMQNEMKAPKAGTIVELNVREGETVNAGDVLAVVE